MCPKIDSITSKLRRSRDSFKDTRIRLENSQNYVNLNVGQAGVVTVICEEASQVSERDLLVALPTSTLHLIMIGTTYYYTLILTNTPRS